VIAFSGQVVTPADNSTYTSGFNPVLSVTNPTSATTIPLDISVAWRAPRDGILRDLRFGVSFNDAQSLSGGPPPPQVRAVIYRLVNPGDALGVPVAASPQLTATSLAASVFPLTTSPAGVLYANSDLVDTVAVTSGDFLALVIQFFGGTYSGNILIFGGVVFE
jgi:hypothetical protein